MLSGNIGIELLFALPCFTGFEATVIFRDEVKGPGQDDPACHPRFIVVMGATYALSVWVIIQAIGSQDAGAATGADPTGAVLATMQEFAGTTFVDIVTVLLCTSGFAAALALHNVLARYIFNLGVDGIIWPRVGLAHPKNGSPCLASITVWAFAVWS